MLRVRFLRPTSLDPILPQWIFLVLFQAREIDVERARFAELLLQLRRFPANVALVVYRFTQLLQRDRFLDRIQSRNIYDLKIQEDFTEFTGENVQDSGLDVEDTSELLRQYVDNVETVLDKERLKKELVELMLEAETIEIQ